MEINADIAKWAPAVVVAVFGLGLMAVGGLLTEIGPWYRGLRKPSWQPPEYLFGPVWTAIFILVGTAALIGWYGAKPGEGGLLIAAFLVNGVLNGAWSGVFFKLKRPDWALAEMAALWLSIVALIAVLAPISAVAAALIVPYLVWVSFAAAINLAIVRLNPAAAR